MQADAGCGNFIRQRGGIGERIEGKAENGYRKEESSNGGEIDNKEKQENSTIPQAD
jgi:hypothetical protein